MQENDELRRPGRSRRKGAGKMTHITETGSAGDLHGEESLFEEPSSLERGRTHGENHYFEEPSPSGRSRTRGSEHGRRPKKKKHTKGFIWARRIIVLLLLEAVVLTGIFAYNFMLKQYSRIQRPDFEVANVENTDLSKEEIQKMKGRWNIAAFGVDSRDGSVGRGNNSDVIMIVSIDKESGEIRIVSVFRDSYLSLANGSYSKINAAYAIGGPELAVKALNQNLGLNITDYVTFNWKAVATGVNILGGIDLNLSNAEFRYINSYITETVKGTGIGSVHLQHAGENHLDGVQAVSYARLRYMDNDYTRTERQRRVIELCYQKAKQADAQTLSDLAGNMLSMVATSLTWEDGMNLALNAKKYYIGETGGFPFDRVEAIMGPKGDCVVPNTLASNVKKLHALLFNEEDYVCPEKVNDISYKISSDLSNYKSRAAGSAADLTTEYSAEAGKTKSTEGSGENTDKPKSTTAPVETDEDGNPVLDYDDDDVIDDGRPPRPVVNQTDADGNILTPERPTVGALRPDSTIENGEQRPYQTEAMSPVRPDQNSPVRPDQNSPVRETTASQRETRPLEPGQGTEDDYVSSGPGHNGSTPQKTTEAASPVRTTEAASPVRTTEAASPVQTPGGSGQKTETVSAPPGAGGSSSGNSQGGPGSPLEERN